MICDKRKFVFIDICRSAGSSIRAALSGVNSGLVKIVPRHHNIRNIDSDHPISSEITEEHIKNYFKFSIVRNPYDRLVSLWNWGRTKDYENLSFKQFVCEACNKKIPFYYRYMPSFEWISDFDGNIKVDFIGRFENLHTDFNKICERIGIKTSRLNRYNRSEERSQIKRLGYKKYYDEKSLKIAAEFYSKDLEIFNYKF